MSGSIKHQGEFAANNLRERLDASTGRGQRTRTPTLAAIANAQGCKLTTVDGRELYDFAAGVLVANLGHAHPRFEQLFATYSAGLPRNSYNMLTPIEVEAAERLLRRMSLPGPRKVFWAASGSEAVQKAMWAALHAQKNKPIMLATRGGFHGKKGLAADVSGESSPNSNVRFISFPLEIPETPEFYQAELDELAQRHAGKIALLITEPYLGAKGSYHPPHWYLQLLQTWAAKNNVVFILDEVQSCFGRTGSMFAYQSYGIEPDLVVLGKGMANGEPAAAVAGRAALIDALDYGEASDTFSGNPRACAAVCAVLDVFEEEKILEKCAHAAKYLRSKLDALQDRFSFIKAIRGEGLVFGVEMANAETARRCVLEAYEGNGARGLHFLGPLAGKVLRVSPPLIIGEEEIDQALSILETAWARVESLAEVT